MSGCDIRMVSIIIPFYNVEKDIQRCLNSVMNQTLVDIEIICINDGSTDNSEQLVNTCKLYDRRIRIVSTSHCGPGYARNYGIQIAKGNYVFFCDADDRIENNMLENMVRNIEKSKSDIVCCDFTEEYGSTNVEHCLEGDSVFEMFFHEAAIWNKLFRKDFLVKNNVCFPVAYRGEDRVFLAYCYSKDPAISYEKGFYYHWIRERGGGNSLNGIVSIAELEERLSNWEQFIKILGEKYRELALKNVFDGKQYIERECKYIPDKQERSIALHRINTFYQKYFVSL